jgi:hypothetical protein
MKLQIGILGYLARSVGIVIGDNGFPPRCEQFTFGIDWRAGDELYIVPKNILNALLSGYSDRSPQQLTKTVTTAVTGYDPRFYGNRFRQILTKHGDPASQFHLSSLTEAAHRGAFMGRDGVLIRCGHGAAVFTQFGPSGVITGGWGTVTGDEGSCIWLGHQAIRCVTALHDKSAKEKDARFAIEILKHPSIKESESESDAPSLLEDLHSKKTVTGERAWKEQLYQIGRITLEIACSDSRGSESALRIVDAGQEHLIDLVSGGLAHAMLQPITAFNLCFAGSMFRNAWFRNRLSARLIARFPNVTLTRPRFSPTMGIALLAMQNSEGSHTDPEVFAAAWGSQPWATAVSGK